MSFLLFLQLQTSGWDVIRWLMCFDFAQTRQLQGELSHKTIATKICWTSWANSPAGFIGTVMTSPIAPDPSRMDPSMPLRDHGSYASFHAPSQAELQGLYTDWKVQRLCVFFKISLIFYVEWLNVMIFFSEMLILPRKFNKCQVLSTGSNSHI